MKALKQDITGLDSFQQNDLLEKLTAQPTPARIKSLKTAKVLHEQIIDIVNQDKILKGKNYTAGFYEIV